MAIREIVVDGQRAAEVDTAEDFYNAIDAGFLIIHTPPGVVEADYFGVPIADENGDPDETAPPSAAEADEDRA
ncbi:MAG: hypothetical protein OXT72_06440 [Gammaproteobacteria bacterium]|nr:hypothetical protein [Gammaproteobacteria bacterium]MDE2882614.1 hypothetical protein [Acidobacteriota bacterium]MYA43384.1 hypothetical protein [Gemmatimonadota bacterium]MYE94572.1 hypothetical protein [Gemmatimonadota bacterium]MYJ10350.1 hypothetical protein [Gemmatimonadota bacterium]